MAGLESACPEVDLGRNARQKSDTEMGLKMDDEADSCRRSRDAMARMSRDVWSISGSLRALPAAHSADLATKTGG